ncbi:MAG: hypothetical protein H7174_11170 [Flavobacterium sp.]|nr:hypothetical protein [Flavobacterium sp.]
MKKLIYLVILNFVSGISFAQQINCGFTPESWMYNLSRYSNRNQTIIDDGRKFVLNVKFHYVLGTNGENPNNLNEEIMLRYLGTMNLKFNQFGVFFKYFGTDYIKDNNFVQMYANGVTETTLTDKFINEGLYNDNAINIL